MVWHMHGETARRSKEDEEEEEESAAFLEARAARAIQNCWRSGVSKSIYRYYRQDQ